jgi:hypothetical protein
MAGRAAQRARPAASVRSYSLAAPVGGLNSVTGLAATPPTDCVVLENVVPGAQGLQTRLGHREWAKGMTGPARTLISFAGAVPADSRLFVATTQGIYDVTAGGAVGAIKITFPDHTGDAGWGSFHAVVNDNGHFLVYCDEVNGYYLYTPNTGVWVKVVQAASTPWTTGASYTINVSYVSHLGVTYLCKTTGLAGATAPTGTGTGISDGVCTWDYAPSVSGFDPATGVFATVWKHRLFIVKRGTAEAYYFDLNAMLGTATRLTFAGKFKSGGHLRGLWSWTKDGAAGSDDNLVAVSSEGDVGIYSGLDPSIPGAFNLAGVWNVGAIPAGRRICTDVGGDLLIASCMGLMPLSKLTVGNLSQDSRQYATVKIGNLFAYYAQQGRAYLGWGVKLHPADGTLLINVPTEAGGGALQFAMNLVTGGWAKYTYDLVNFDTQAAYVITTCEAFQGVMYFGTSDGRVLENAGGSDGATILHPEAAANISFFLIGAFQKLGTARMKRIHFIRASVTAQGQAPTYQCRPMFKYDLAPFSGGVQVSTLPGDKFTTDGAAEPPAHAVFDVATFFASDFFSEQRSSGASGMGAEIAIAMSGRASVVTVIIGWDVMFDVGGLL